MNGAVFPTAGDKKVLLLFTLVKRLYLLCACWKNEVKKGKKVINIKKCVHLFSTQHATCSTVRLIGSGLHDSRLSLNPEIPSQKSFF